MVGVISSNFWTSWWKPINDDHSFCLSWRVEMIGAICSIFWTSWRKHIRWPLFYLSGSSNRKQLVIFSWQKLAKLNDHSSCLSWTVGGEYWLGQCFVWFSRLKKNERLYKTWKLSSFNRKMARQKCKLKHQIVKKSFPWKSAVNRF